MYQRDKSNYFPMFKFYKSTFFQNKFVYTIRCSPSVLCPPSCHCYLLAHFHSYSAHRKKNALRTDGRTDTPSYRVAYSQLNTVLRDYVHDLVVNFSSGISSSSSSSSSSSPLVGHLINTTYSEGTFPMGMALGDFQCKAMPGGNETMVNQHFQ